MHDFMMTFIPLFVAVDAMGILPLYLNLVEGQEEPANRRTVLRSVATALGVGVLFLFLGRSLLRILGITIADFMIAGGALLFLLSVGDLLTADKLRRKGDREDVGPVPVGVPLIVGPAVLATALLLIEEQGIAATLVSLCLNILLAGVVLWFSPLIARLSGKAGARIISKLAGVLLAAYAVMMIRRGVAVWL